MLAALLGVTTAAIVVMFGLDSNPHPAGTDRGRQARVSERLTGLAVVGHGKVTAVPDLAAVRVSAAAEAGSAAEALDQVTGAMRSIVREAAAAGVSEADRQTQGMHLESWRERPGRPMRHQAAQQLLLRLRDIENAGDLVQQVLAAGGDHAGINSFTLVVDDRDPHLERARELAMADAHRHAEQLARLAQRPLGPVIAVAENPGRDPIWGSSGVETIQMGAAGPGGPPVQAGELDIEVRLAVEYAWGD